MSQFLLLSGLLPIVRQKSLGVFPHQKMFVDDPLSLSPHWLLLIGLPPNLTGSLRTEGRCSISALRARETLLRWPESTPRAHHPPSPWSSSPFWILFVFKTVIFSSSWILSIHFYFLNIALEYYLCGLLRFLEFSHISSPSQMPHLPHPNPCLVPPLRHMKKQVTGHHLSWKSHAVSLCLFPWLE